MSHRECRYREAKLDEASASSCCCSIRWQPWLPPSMNAGKQSTLQRNEDAEQLNERRTRAKE